MKNMVGKVNKAEGIILGLKRTGHPNIGDLLATLQQKQNTILTLEDELSSLTQTTNFTKKENRKISEECQRLFEGNKELTKLLGCHFSKFLILDELKVHHNNVNDENQLLIKQLRSDIYELHSQNLLFEQNARNSHKLTQRAVEDHVVSQQELAVAQSELQLTHKIKDTVVNSFVQYQQRNPAVKPTEIKRKRRFVLD